MLHQNVQLKYLKSGQLNQIQRDELRQVLLFRFVRLNRLNRISQAVGNPVELLHIDDFV